MATVKATVKVTVKAVTVITALNRLIMAIMGSFITRLLSKASLIIKTKTKIIVMARDQNNIIPTLTVLIILRTIRRTLKISVRTIITTFKASL